MLYETIARRHREGNSSGAGVTILAKSAGHAPVIYTAMLAGMGNTYILAHECACALIQIIRNPAKVMAYVPEYDDWR